MNPVFRIRGSCNGLVLLGRDLEYFVINPSTKRSIRLPPFPKNCAVDCICDVSLGFDPQARQYKAMLNFYDQGQHHFAITTVGLSESWRVISGGDQVYCPIEMQSSVRVNGAWHWLTHSGEHVVSLDASKEMFFYVRLPNPEMKHKYLLRLVVYEDCLAVFERVPPLISAPHHPRQLDIWVLQDLYKSEWRKHSFNMNSLEDQFIVQENSIASVQMDHYGVTLLDVGENRTPDYFEECYRCGRKPHCIFEMEK
ncbi:putative F-box protein [Acorus calamus]|uniref:F-box protein n=1 Tax=Acorus calamus TaxID=4465 RepID=A0AAV9CLH2_ACOCL|nr:putative F-box protein [Acorus calamus]